MDDAAKKKSNDMCSIPLLMVSFLIMTSIALMLLGSCYDLAREFEKEQGISAMAFKGKNTRCHFLNWKTMSLFSCSLA